MKTFTSSSLFHDRWYLCPSSSVAWQYHTRSHTCGIQHNHGHPEIYQLIIISGVPGRGRPISRPGLAQLQKACSVTLLACETSVSCSQLYLVPLPPMAHRGSMANTTTREYILMHLKHESVCPICRQRQASCGWNMYCLPDRFQSQYPDIVVDSRERLPNLHRHSFQRLHCHHLRANIDPETLTHTQQASENSFLGLLLALPSRV